MTSRSQRVLTRSLWSLLLALGLIVAAAVPLAGPAAAGPVTSPQADEPPDDEEPCAEEGEGEEDPEEEALCGPTVPGEFKAHQDTSGGIGLPVRALLTAAEEARGVPTVGGDWITEGPSNVGGRVTGVAVDPLLRDTVYLASASGGVWRSTDAGGTFQPLWPTSFPQAIGAIAMGRDGVLWVGTGEANPGGGSLTYEGDGLYRSQDRGRTWQRVALPNSATIGEIAVDPTNPRRVIVAATGSLFRPGGQRGVFLTVNGGQTFRRVLAGESPTTGAVDVQIDPRNPRRIYAAMWDHQRTPALRIYGGHGSGVFRSTNGGETWQRLDNITEPAPGDDIGLNSPFLGRIAIGVAADIPGRVYVITSSFGDHTEAGEEIAFYASNDFGASFQARTDSEPGGPIWWTGKVWVDPTDGNHVFVPGIDLRETFDGARTWADSAGMHVDHHAMVWDRKVPGRIYEGNDGGVYRSDANGATNTWVKATNEPWTQFYSVTVSNQDTTRIAGGTQDNGSLRTYNGARWNRHGGGDGEQNTINPQNQDNILFCSQFGSCRRSVNGGNTSVRFGPAVSDRFNWFSPVEFAAHDPNVVYFGGTLLSRSTDGGATFTPISPDLTGGPGNDPIYPFGTLTTVWSSQSDPNVIYVGTDDGRVWVTSDGGANWRLSLSDQPWVTRVKIDEQDPNVAFVTLSGYRAGTEDGHVLMTTDGGVSWTDITQNLPQTPVNDVILGPADSLFVATDVGVFATESAGSVWLGLGGELPLVPVTDIDYNAASDTLFAATFGRGVYRLPGSGAAILAGTPQ